MIKALSTKYLLLENAFSGILHNYVLLGKYQSPRPSPEQTMPDDNRDN